MTFTSPVHSELFTNSSLLPSVINYGHWVVVVLSIGWLHKTRTRRESRN